MLRPVTDHCPAPIITNVHPLAPDRSRAVRLLLAVVALLGLFAMHGLAGHGVAGHGVAGSLGADGSIRVAGVAAHPPGDLVDSVEALGGPRDAAGTGAGLHGAGTSAGHGDGNPLHAAIAGLCLALLAVLVVIVARRGWWRRVLSAPDRAISSPHRLFRSLRPRPPPDLVALGVCRC